MIHTDVMTQDNLAWAPDLVDLIMIIDTLWSELWPVSYEG